MRSALAFLTPFGGAAPPGGVEWFPLVGALIGAVVGLLWWAAGHAFPPAVAAVLAVGADLGATGMLHVDGLCDAADGLVAPMDRWRRLSVMAAPDIGAFGVAAAVVCLLARVTAMANVHPNVALIVGLWCASRACMALTMTVVPYARPGGLASAFLGGDRRRVVTTSVVGIAAAAGVAAAWRPLAGVAAVTAGVIAFAAVVALGWRRIGGFTGDVLGAAGVVGESLGLVVACAKW